MDKSIKTNIFIPYIRKERTITYAEVKKPSGIAYILLVLIKESKTPNVILENLLIKFGIPKSLHYLFTDTLNNLINQAILECDHLIDDLSVTKINMFKFTEKGTKMFLEECLPTGREKTARLPLIYDCAHNSYIFNIESSRAPRVLHNYSKELPLTFVDNLKEDISDEDFLNLTKGQEWPIYNAGKKIDTLTIAKDNIITNVNSLSQSKACIAAIAKCCLKFQDGSLELDFDDEEIKKFVYDHYSSKEINHALSINNEFSKFSLKDSAEASFLDNPDVERIFVSYNDIESYLKTNAKLIIDFMSDISHDLKHIIYDTRKSALSEKYMFMYLDNNNEPHNCLVRNVHFKYKESEIVTLILFISCKGTIDELIDATRRNFANFDLKQTNQLKEFAYVIENTKDGEGAKEAVLKYLTSDDQSNLISLKEMFEKINGNGYFGSVIKEMANTYYMNCVNNLTESNLDSFVELNKNIKNIIDIKDVDLLSLIHEKIGNKDPLSIYEKLVSGGFDPRVVCVLFNPIPQIISGGVSKDKTLLNFFAYKNNLFAIKDDLKMHSPYDYSIDEDQINIDNFIKKYKTMKSNKKDAFVFQDNDKNLFDEMIAYENIFDGINQYLVLKADANKDIKKLKKDLVLKYINNGDYRTVIANLAVKLEYLLKNVYKSHGIGLGELLSNSKGIDKEKLDVLYKFKDSRNHTLHYSENNNFSSDDLKYWTEVIFSLEGKNE